MVDHTEGMAGAPPLVRTGGTPTSACIASAEETSRLNKPYLVPIYDDKVTETCAGLEQAYVHDVYDDIADAFSHTRHKVRSSLPHLILPCLIFTASFFFEGR